MFLDGLLTFSQTELSVTRNSLLQLLYQTSEDFINVHSFLVSCVFALLSSLLQLNSIIVHNTIEQSVNQA